jgi:hypothetical protein
MGCSGRRSVCYLAILGMAGFDLADHRSSPVCPFRPCEFRRPPHIHDPVPCSLLFAHGLRAFTRCRRIFSDSHGA